jgi:hypothetical protein
MSAPSVRGAITMTAAGGTFTSGERAARRAASWSYRPVGAPVQ